MVRHFIGPHGEDGSESVMAAFAMPVVILLTFACFQVSLSAYQAVALNSAIDAAVLSADFSKAVASGDVASEVREEILAKNATLSDAGLAVESAEVRWTTSSDSARASGEAHGEGLLRRPQHNRRVRPGRDPSHPRDFRRGARELEHRGEARMRSKRRDEGGAIAVMTAFLCLILTAGLAFAGDAAASNAARSALVNDLSAARDATMSADVLLVAKNSDDPGRAIADAAVSQLRANGVTGEVEVWFWEAPSSQLPTGKRSWAWGVQSSVEGATGYATIFGGSGSEISAFITAHAVPYTAGEAWRPSSERMGKWAYAEGAEAGEGSFERVASLGETPQEIQDELADAVREAQQS